jgi:hypothetical protein
MAKTNLALTIRDFFERHLVSQRGLSQASEFSKLCPLGESPRLTKAEEKDS